MTIAFEALRTLSLDPAMHPHGRAFLSAASGLVRVRDRFFVVADDELHLGVFDAGGSASLHLVRLFDGDLPESAKQRKKLKPDLEALVLLPASTPGSLGTLLALGSGSRSNRFVGAMLQLDDSGGIAGAAESVDLEPLYRAIAARVDRVNVEGAFVCGSELVLLQRGGTGAGAVNAAVRFDLGSVMAWLASGGSSAPVLRAIQAIDLGHVDGVPLSFTDGATLGGGDWLFSAVAERTDNAYDDGPCVAALLGIADREGHVRATHRIEPVRKVEGIAARIVGAAIEVHMVTDDDDPGVPATFGITRFAV